MKERMKSFRAMKEKQFQERDKNLGDEVEVKIGRLENVISSCKYDLSRAINKKNILIINKLKNAEKELEKLNVA